MRHSGTVRVRHDKRGNATLTYLEPWGARVMPVYDDAFDYDSGKGAFQVRIHLWGWLGKIVYRLFTRHWRAGSIDVPENGIAPYHSQHPVAHCHCKHCLLAYYEAYLILKDKAEEAPVRSYKL